MTGLINLLSYGIVTGSLLLPSRQKQDVIDHEVGARFIYQSTAQVQVETYTGCDVRFYAGHSDRAFGVAMKEKINSGSIVQDGDCKYLVVERKQVFRKGYVPKLTPGYSMMQTCRVDDASEILIIILKSI